MNEPKDNRPTLKDLNDFWGKMNEQFQDFFGKSQPVPAEHHNEKGKN